MDDFTLAVLMIAVLIFAPALAGIYWVFKLRHDEEDGEEDLSP